MTNEQTTNNKKTEVERKPISGNEPPTFCLGSLYLYHMTIVFGFFVCFFFFFSFLCCFFFIKEN